MSSTVQPLSQAVHEAADQMILDGDANSATILAAIARRSASLQRVLSEDESRKRTPVSSQPQFMRALPLSDLLAEHAAAVEQTTVQPTLDARNEHVPDEHNHQHISDPAFYSQHQPRLETTAFIGERIVQLCTTTTLADDSAPHPYAMDGFGTALQLGEQFGQLTSCTSPNCEGRHLPGGFPLAAYLTTDEMRQYFMTGELPPPEQSNSLCYLCILKFLNAGVSMMAAVAGQTVGDRRLRVPFYHPQNVPGGYTASAMHPACQRMPSNGVLYPIRRYSRDDYVLTSRTVSVPTAFDPKQRRATEWTTMPIRCYAERADLFYAAPTASIGVRILPCETITAPVLMTCEEVLARRFLPPAIANAALEDVMLGQLFEMSKTLGLSLSLQLTLGGQLAPRTLAVPRVELKSVAPRQTALMTLLCCDLTVARARVIYAVASSLNDWSGVFRRYSLLPPAGDSLLTGLPYSSHILCYLVEARWRELTRLLEPNAQSLDVMPLGTADALVQALGSPGVRTQLIEYRRSLMPLRNWMRQRRESDFPLEDTEWFASERQNPVCPYLRLRPNPPPVYFSPSDIVAAAQDIHLQTVVTPGPAQVLAAAVNGLPSNVLGDAMPQDYVLAFGELAACERELDVRRVANSAAHRAYWLPECYEECAQLANGAIRVDELYTITPDNPAAYTRALRAAIIDTPERCRLWVSLLWRVNAGYALLHWICGELSMCDQVLQHRSGLPCVWLPDDWDAEQAQRLAAVLQRHVNNLDLMQHLVPCVASMPPLDEVAAIERSQRHSLTQLAQLIKRHLASHVPLINALLDSSIIYDADAASHRKEYAPVGGWCRWMLCDETMMRTATHIDQVDFVDTHLVSSPFSWIMSAVAPTSAHVADFVGRQRQCIEQSDECVKWSGEMFYAHLCGLYPHARNMAPFDAWLRLYRLVAPATPVEKRRATLLRYLDAHEDERLCFLAARERLVADVNRAPAYDLHIRAVYGDWRNFCINVLAQCENIRARIDGCQLQLCNQLAVQSVARTGQPHWGVYHAQPPSFPAFVAQCCHEVDVKYDQGRCVAARRALSAQDLCPSRALLWHVGSYVETRTCREPTVFERRWFSDLGVAESSIDLVERLYREYNAGAVNDAGGEAMLTRLNACSRNDYLVVAIFYTLMRAHSRRWLVPLDAWTTARQYEALIRHCGVERDLFGASQCLASSVQCCNTLRVHTNEAADSPGGFLKMRMSLTTDTMMCHSKIGKAAPASTPGDEGDDEPAPATGRARTTEMRCNEALLHLEQAEARLAAGADGDERARATHLKQVQKALDAYEQSMRAHVQSACRQRYRLPCKLMPMTKWPAVGYVFEQREPSGRGVSCTVCPNCGVMTAFSAGMWSANGFQCTACDDVFREKLRQCAPLRCAVCERSISEQSSLARSMVMRMAGAASNAESGTMRIVDDTQHPIVTTVSERALCQICNRRWMPTAARMFTLQDLRWLVENRESFGNQLVNVVDSPMIHSLQEQLAAAKLDPRAPVPRVQSITDLPQRQRRRQRRLPSAESNASKPCKRALDQDE